MGHIILNGKQWRSAGSFTQRRWAVANAKQTRKGNWHARVVKEGKEYTVYVRAKIYKGT